MDHVKKQRGRRPKVELPEGDVPIDPPKEWEPRILHLRDQREYVVLERHPEGWLVAEMHPDFGKMGDVHFWRREFIEEIKRRNYVIPERRKK